MIFLHLDAARTLAAPDLLGVGKIQPRFDRRSADVPG
jgi:hypothetical protein